MAHGGIFDRVDIVEAIRISCLGEEGASRFLLGSHKVGKSRLLDYIYAGPREDANMYCRINVDLLSAWKDAPEDPLTDKVFLDFLLNRLEQSIKDCLSRQEPHEQRWEQAIEEDDRRLQTLEGEDNSGQFRQAIERRRSAYSERLTELDVLRASLSKIAQLVGQSIVKTRKVASLLDDLRRIRKRIVLFIDDYHRILVETGFTDDLFRFLRGVNAEGSMIVLASSPIPLMDQSLHTGLTERSALVNHIKAQPLEPFNDSQANSFLDWLNTSKPKLTTNERQYLCELGGGSPYFLEAAYEQFCLRGRPSLNDRMELEQKYLAPTFEAGFRNIWQRLPAEKRAILREVAAGNAIATGGEIALELQREGYLVLNGANARMFSPLFNEFVKRQKEDEPEADLVVLPKISYEFFPTALCIAVPKATEPLVNFIISNPRKQKARVRVSCWLGEYLEDASKVVPVPPRKSITVPFPAILKKKNVKALTDSDNTVAKYKVEELAGTDTIILEEDFLQVQILAIDQFIFARRDTVRGRIIDYTWLIAAWVQDNEAALQEIRQIALENLPLGLTGYPPSGPDSAEKVRTQVKALYLAVKQKTLYYDTSAATYDQDVTSLKQRVRLPGRIIKEKGANCLEGCVLFASLLSASEIHPIILFLPGHAIVGWKVNKNDDDVCEFIETTGIMSDTFEQALKTGSEQYECFEQLCKEWKERAPEDPRQPREIRDPKNIVIPVDIHKVLKTWNMVRLPHVEASGDGLAKGNS